jgi:hypothetical protein
VEEYEYLLDAMGVCAYEGGGRGKYDSVAQDHRPRYISISSRYTRKRRLRKRISRTVIEAVEDLQHLCCPRWSQDRPSTEVIPTLSHLTFRCVPAARDVDI